MGALILYAVSIILGMIIATIMSMVIIYFNEILNRLKVTQHSSVNLLNGMHEGVLILSQTS